MGTLNKRQLSVIQDLILLSQARSNYGYNSLSVELKNLRDSLEDSNPNLHYDLDELLDMIITDALAWRLSLEKSY